MRPQRGSDLIIDGCRDALDTSATSEPANITLRHAFDVVAQDLAVRLRLADVNKHGEVHSYR